MRGRGVEIFTRSSGDDALAAHGEKHRGAPPPAFDFRESSCCLGRLPLAYIAPENSAIPTQNRAYAPTAAREPRGGSR